MQISRRILVACVTATILSPIFLQAAETEAQMKARQALEEKMNELSTQPATSVSPRPASPKPKPAQPKKKKPLAPIAQPTPQFIQPAPVATAVQPAAHPESQGQPAQFEAVPQPVSNADAEKARQALRQKMNELEQQPAVAAQPVTTSAEPVFHAVPGDASSGVTTDNGSKPDVAMQPEPQPKKAKTEPVATVKPVPTFQPMQGPPTGLSAAQEQRLQVLLEEYKMDKLSPDE